MEPNPWISALRHSHDSLHANVEPLREDRLRQGSYCSEWSIAQVLSHLGSGAEIFSLFLEAGLNGTQPPGQDAFPPIWQAWNDRSPQAQASDALAVDETLVKRLESLTPDEQAQVRLQLFGMDLDVTGLVRLRLGEHAVHSWDVAVALDPAATVAADAVALLIDTLAPLIGGVAARRPSRRPCTWPRPTLTATFMLSTGDPVSLEASARRGQMPGTRRGSSSQRRPCSGWCTAGWTRLTRRPWRPTAWTWTRSAYSPAWSVPIRSPDTRHAARIQRGRTVHLPLKARDLPGRIAARRLHPARRAGEVAWRRRQGRGQCTAWPRTPSRCSEAIPPERFLRMLAAGEIAVGSALLAPVVPAALAGAALTGSPARCSPCTHARPRCASQAASGRARQGRRSARTSGCWASGSA